MRVIARLDKKNFDTIRLNKTQIIVKLICPDLENNSTCWDFKHNAKGGK